MSLKGQPAAKKGKGVETEVIVLSCICYTQISDTSVAPVRHACAIHPIVITQTESCCRLALKHQAVACNYTWL